MRVPDLRALLGCLIEGRPSTAGLSVGIFADAKAARGRAALDHASQMDANIAAGHR